MLYSPVRLALVVLAMVVLAVGAFVLSARTDRGSEHAASPAGTTSPSAATMSSTGGTTRVPRPAERPTSGASVRPVVERFLSSYLGPTTRQELQAVKPLVTPALWNGLRLTDPTALPAGPATKVRPTKMGAYAASYDVTTADGTIAVSLVLEPEGWRINDVEPAGPDSRSSP